MLQWCVVTYRGRRLSCNHPHLSLPFLVQPWQNSEPPSIVPTIICNTLSSEAGPSNVRLASKLFNQDFIYLLAEISLFHCFGFFLYWFPYNKKMIEAVSSYVWVNCLLFPFWNVHCSSFYLQLEKYSEVWIVPSIILYIAQLQFCCLVWIPIYGGINHWGPQLETISTARPGGPLVAQSPADDAL